MILLLLQASILLAAGAIVAGLAPRTVDWRIAPFTVALAAEIGFVIVGIASLTMKFGVQPGVLTMTALFCAALVGVSHVGRLRGGPILSFLQATLLILSIGFVWAARQVTTGYGSLTQVALVLTASYLVIALGLGGRGLGRLLDAIPGSLLAMGGCLLVLLPLLTGGKTNGAFIQFKVPLIGSTQPGELGRVLLIVWLARAVAFYRAELLTGGRFHDVVATLSKLTFPALFAAGIGVLGNDLGPALILVATTGVMVVVGGLRWRDIAMVLVTAVVAVMVAWRLSCKVAERVADMTDPLHTAAGGNLGQIGSGLAAIAHGPTGLGLGAEAAVPAWNTDLLAVSIAHEMGIGVLIAVLVGVLGTAVAAWRLVVRLADDRVQLRVAGLSALVASQAMFMVGALLSLAPLTGMTIPFLSYSGSSLIASGVAAGVVLSAWPHVDATPGSVTIRTRMGVWTVLVAVLCVGLMGKAGQVWQGREALIEAIQGRDPVASQLRLAAVGDIVTADGQLIRTVVRKEKARGVLRPGVATRSYPHGGMYTSLLGDRSYRGLDYVIGQRQTCEFGSCPANTVTLRHAVQEVAWKGLEGKTGSVVAADLTTGEIIVHVSRGPAGSAPDRIRRHTIVPGSVVKTLTAVAAINQGMPLERPVLREFEGVHSMTGKPCGGTLASAMATSCNPYFASMGADLGTSGLRDASKWLNSQPTLSGLQVEDSQLVAADDEAGMALRGAIGLGNAKATPFGLLSATAQIARGGQPLCLHVLKDDPVSCADQPTMPESAAKRVAAAMRTVVTDGTAKEVPGIHELEAAAKTGTADFDGNISNATFVAFAPASAPRYAVVVVVEPGEEQIEGLRGGRDAGPIAVQVLKAAMKIAK